MIIIIVVGPIIQYSRCLQITRRRASVYALIYIIIYTCRRRYKILPSGIYTRTYIKRKWNNTTLISGGDPLLRQTSRHRRLTRPNESPHAGDWFISAAVFGCQTIIYNIYSRDAPTTETDGGGEGGVATAAAVEVAALVCIILLLPLFII